MSWCPALRRPRAALRRREAGRRPRAARPATGFTLVELIVGLAILSILMAGSWPGLAEALERRRLAAASVEALGLLQQARLEAQSRNEALRVTARTGAGAGSCLLLHTGPARACACEPPTPASASLCVGEARVLRMVVATGAHGLSWSANVDSMRFDPSLGTTTPAGRVVLRSRRGAVHHVVSATGRVRRCLPPSADGLVSLPGLAAC